MFFEIAGPGKAPIPLLPFDEKRKPRKADGETIFDLAGAARASGQSEQYLRDLWNGTWEQILQPDDSPIVTEKDSTAGGTEAAVAVDAAVVRIDEARHMALRTMLFPHLNDEQFEQFSEMCRLRGLNPFARQVYAKVEFDRRLDREVVMVIVSIEGLRLIAQRTGLVAGCDDAQFEVDESSGTITRAIATVYRLTGDKRFPYTASAWWMEYAPLGDDEFFGAMPRVSLGRCAEAAAWRKAFPQELGGIYAPEELRRMDSIYRQRTESTADARYVNSQVEPAAPRLMSAPPDAPRTYDQFIDELESLGVETEEDRVKLIRHFRQKRGPLAEQNPSAFWKYVLAEVRKDPGKWITAGRAVAVA